MEVLVIVVGLCTRIVAAAATAQVDRNMEYKLLMERCRRLKEWIDCIDIAIAEQKAHLHDCLQGCSRLQCYAPIEPQVVADLCTGNTSIAAAAALAGHVDRNTKHTHMEMLDNLCKERWRRIKEPGDCFDIAMAQEQARLRNLLQGLLLLQCYSLSSDNYICGELEWNVRYKIIKGICEAVQYLHNTPVIHLDLKPQNMSIGTLYNPSYVEFTVGTSPKGGAVIKIVSHAIRVPRYLRLSSDNYLCGELEWNVRYKIIKGFCDAIQFLHNTSIIHLDLKPQNILLDHCYVPKISDFGTTRLLHDSHNITARKVGSRGTLYNPSYVEFTVGASAKGGAVIKIGSHVIRMPRYLSVHHPLVQMVLLARNKFADTFACCESMTPKSIFDMAKRLHAFALSNWWKTDWNLARPKSGLPKVGTFSDFSTSQSIVQKNELTENESHPSDIDGSGAAWVAATAAPHHATGNRSLLAGFIIEHDDQFVHAVDGVPRKVLARGAVITDSVVLPDVWFVPGLTENLVSVSQLVDLDHSVGFSCGECCIRRTDGKVVGKGRLQEGGIYVLDFLKVPLAI